MHTFVFIVRVVTPPLFGLIAILPWLLKKEEVPIILYFFFMRGKTEREKLVALFGLRAALPFVLAGWGCVIFIMAMGLLILSSY